MRILLWEQHFRGAGHYVRMSEIASRLCERHEVSLLIGGHEPSFSRLSPVVRKVQLPIVVPRPQGPLDYIEREERADCYTAGDGGDIHAVLPERRRIIEEEVRRLRPDVFMTEYFPLGRSLFGEELLPAIACVRAQSGRVLCSVRDVLQGDIKARIGEDDRSHSYKRRLRFHEKGIATLNASFDHLLIHGDPRFMALDATVPSWLLEMIHIPVTYTGYVSERLPQKQGCPDEIAAMLDRGGFVVTSVGTGGSGGSDPFSHGGGAIGPAIEAWKLVAARGRAGQRTMVIFAGTHSTADDLERLRRACAGGPFLVLHATRDFLCWLQSADLSISRAGYNTCTNILATGVPSILLPSRSNIDQEPRARVFAIRGMGYVLHDDELNPERLAHIIERALERMPATHEVALDGAKATAALMESMA